MVEFKIIYLLLFVVAIFLLYHLLSGCGCYNGLVESFSVGGQNKINISNLLSLSYIPECNPSPPSPPSPPGPPPKSLFKCEYKTWWQYVQNPDDCDSIVAEPDETYPIDIPSYWKSHKKICIPKEKYKMNASCIYHDSCESGACKKEEGEDYGVCVDSINCSGKYGDCKNCIKEYDISEYPKGNGKECPHSVTCSSEDEGCKEFKECNSNASCNLGEICVVNKCLNCSDITIHVPNNEKYISYASYLCEQYEEYCDIYKRKSYRDGENQYICRTKQCPRDRDRQVDEKKQYINSCSKINNEETCNKTKIVKCKNPKDNGTCPEPDQDYWLYELCHYNNNTCTNINSEGNINYCKSY